MTSQESQEHSSKNIFEIKEESQQNEELGSESESEASEKIDSSLSQVKWEDQLKKEFSSALVFIPMGVEGERLKDQEAKRVVDVWGIQVRDMFYDQHFQHLITVVGFCLGLITVLVGIYWDSFLLL